MNLPKISSSDGLKLARLVRPYAGSLSVAVLAVIGEGLTGLLEPWPLKIVFDSVSGSKPVPAWLASRIPAALTANKMATLELAAIAVVVIAILNAVFSYIEKLSTTSAGQWIMHDLRRRLYHHIQHLSLGFHTQKRTGDLISRITTDVEAIQTFIVSDLLGLVVDVITLAGMAAVMFYIRLEIHAARAFDNATAVCRVLFLHAPQQDGVARCKAERGRNRLASSGRSCQPLV